MSFPHSVPAARGGMGQFLCTTHFPCGPQGHSFHIHACGFFLPPPGKPGARRFVWVASEGRSLEQFSCGMMWFQGTVWSERSFEKACGLSFHLLLASLCQTITTAGVRETAWQHSRLRSSWGSALGSWQTERLINLPAALVTHACTATCSPVVLHGQGEGTGRDRKGSRWVAHQPSLSAVPPDLRIHVSIPCTRTGWALGELAPAMWQLVLIPS